MDVLVVVDMQERIHDGVPKHDLAGVVSRIGLLAARVRVQGGTVIFIQHEDPEGGEVPAGSPGWEILAELGRQPTDLVVAKTHNDGFFETPLAAQIRALSPERVVVTGWATDMCVDATLRSAAALGFRVVGVRDGTTVAERDHLPAEKIIEHHHWVWTNMISQHPVSLLAAADV